MIDITKDNFEAEVLKSGIPVVVDAWAVWCGPCVTPDTVLLGDNKPISQVQANDYVFTQTGHNQVKDSFSRQYDGDILTVKACGMLPFQITPEHPVLISTSESTDRIIGMSSTYWKEAGNLIAKEKDDDGDYLVIPKLKGNTDTKLISLGKYIADRNISMASRKNVPLEFPLNEDTAWLLGLYVAEGNASDNAVVFNLGAKEVKLQNEVIRIGKDLGYSPCISHSSQSAVKVSIKSRLLTRAFPEWCGHLAPNKKIPDFILMHKNDAIPKKFLEGYLIGDGNKRDGMQFARSVSKLLMIQLQLLYTRFGKFAVLQLSQKGGVSKILGRTVHTHDMYTMCVRENGATQARQTPEYIYVPIREITRKAYSGVVCNIETADNTYLINNAVVHNCRIFSPIFEGLEKDFSKKVKFAKLNVDENPDISGEYNIMSIPTTLLFEKGNVKAMSVGAVPKEDFKKWLEKNL